MKSAHKFACILLFACGSALADDAARAAFPTVLGQFKAVTTAFGRNMVPVGGVLLASLATLQVVWNCVDRILKGSFEPNAIIGNLIRTSLTSAFFFVVLTHAGAWFPYILSEWNRIGGQAAGTGPLEPGALMGTGIDLVEAIREAARQKASISSLDVFRSVSISLQLVLIFFLVLLAFFCLAGQLALAMIKGFLWFCVGPLLLGFGGLKSTRDIAVNTLKAGISTGVVILTVYVIAGITINCVPLWNDLITKFTMDDWTPFWGIVVTAGLLALSAWQVPKIANDFINGSVSGGLSEVSGAAITGAAAAAGVGATAVAAGAATSGVAKAGAASILGMLEAGQAAMGTAGDAGKSGMGAAIHAGGTLASATASAAGNAVKDHGASILQSIQAASQNSLGAQVARQIESERGGSISPDSGGGSNVGTSGGSGQDANLSDPTNNGAATTTSVASGVTQPSTAPAMGDASTASIGGSADSPLPANSLQPQEQQPYKAPLHERIRDLGAYVPDAGDASVAVSMNTHHVDGE